MDEYNPTTRFSDRVADYMKYRPGYPPEIYDYLQRNAALNPGDRVVDLGSGTGLLSRIFLERGHALIAVEPNTEMRRAAESLLGNQPGFTSLEGRAENIPLSAASADFVAAGQAFHWFEPAKARAEIQRVLKPHKQVALVWNSRDLSSPFMQAYERILLDFGKDFSRVDQQRVVSDDSVAAFFAPNSAQKATFPNQQVFGFEGLRGRLLSSSYAPLEGQPGHATMLAALRSAFEEHQKDDLIPFDYVTVVYHGPLDP
jgi:SAM-dependent methyltransferase